MRRGRRFGKDPLTIERALYVRFASVGVVIAGVGLLELWQGSWSPALSLALVVFGLASVVLFGVLLWINRRSGH